MSISVQTMNEYPPLYDDMFRRLEKVRWTLSDIDFKTVDKQAVSRQTLDFIRVNCQMELSSLYAVRMFLRDFQQLPDFCQFMSIWYYEEMKHYLVLREYLKLFDMAPDVDSYQQLDLDLAPSPWPPTLAFHYCGELRLGMWYHRWADLEQEPVLVNIFRLIGNDEFRHAGCYKEFMQRAVQQHPHLLVEFLQASKWMLVNPAGDKHPTTMKTNDAKDTSVVDQIEHAEILQRRIEQTIRPEDEQRVQKQVLTTLGRMAKRELNTMLDLVKLTRELSAEKKNGIAVAG